MFWVCRDIGSSRSVSEPFLKQLDASRFKVALSFSGGKDELCVENGKGKRLIYCEVSSRCYVGYMEQTSKTVSCRVDSCH
jgi:hypothetical protein